MEEHAFFAAALDADKRQVRTPMSNPGHCLYCGIVDEDKASPLAKALRARHVLGLGIRTMARWPPPTTR